MSRTRGAGQHPCVWRGVCQSWVTGSLPPGRTQGLVAPSAFCCCFSIPVFILSASGAPWPRPSRGKENALAPFSPPEPPSRLSSFRGTCGLALARGHVFFPRTGLMRLRFLFRPSGTQQFIPTGKYKADGVLETVRLSGKLSRNPWLCLGPVSFHISKSFLCWGGASLPCSPACRALHLGWGRQRWGLWGWALARLALWPPKRLLGGL